MPLVFKTPKDSPHAVELVGVGVLPAGGVGGLTIAEAARRGFAPLVEHDDAGYPIFDDETGAYVPLEGPALAAAARKWAEDNGAEAVNLQPEAIAKLAAANGAVVDEYPDAHTKAEEEAARTAPVLVANDEPDAVAAGVAVAHAPEGGGSS